MKRAIYSGLMIIGICLCSQALFAQGNTQALVQAIRQNAFGGGQYEGMFTPTPQQMLERADRVTLQKLASASNAIQQNLNNVDALVQRGYFSMDMAEKGAYKIFWNHFAAKDFERALSVDPNNFIARHNYAQLCYQTGDVSDGQPIMHLAVTHFTKAIQLKPDSARSYMGRGWAYLMMDDETHAQADFQKALQVDPSLQASMTREINAIRTTRGEKGCVKAMMARLGAYYVNRNARNYDQCMASRGFWAGSECRISTATAPGPIAVGPQDAATANAGLGGPSCLPPPDAVYMKYSPRAGGYFGR